MKKIINSLCALILMIGKVNAQSISPNETQEYCPGTNINFTVTVPGTITNITSYSGGCSVISRNANTFVGRFNDVNVKQVYRIEYTDAKNILQSYYPEFQKVKSLFYGNLECGLIQPNLPSITAPACQVTNIPISFTKIKWFTQFENPALCFGAVDNYEYQIPVGWSLGITLV